ncbi:hypothetical protein [Cereibacter sphaeroides]|uniref:hypothetical protein n=1 Tax=Cereibacter sphaeroides TaxID=1063 RepID=UPI001F2DA615|nr:hypothetical protein [Cereibacter sphaeroides]MCE6968754.1 hypothetical protein [Cereibacter sphaeroides]
MHDGSFPGLVPGLCTARLALTEDGRLGVTLDGRVVPARFCVAGSVADAGAEAVVARLEEGPVVLGILRPARETEVVIDGNRLTLEATREIVLRCGQASLTLSADGSVTVLGTRILSRAGGVNRLQGASVHLN